MAAGWRSNRANRVRHEALWQAGALMSDPADAAILKDPIARDDLVAKYQARGQLDDALGRQLLMPGLVRPRDVCSQAHD